MKILACLSNSWGSYISNKMKALVSAMQRDSDFVMALDYKCEPRDDIAAVLGDQYGPPLPAWLPDKVVRLRLGGDLHRFSAAEQNQFAAATAEYDMILSAYRFASPENPPLCYHWPTDEVRRKLVFFPHCVPDAYPPSSGERNGGLLSGNIDKAVYPWRAWVKTVLSSVDVLPHPGYEDPATMATARDSYFATLSRYRAAFTCNSVLDYTVAKYLEIPYCGCVLIAAEPNPVDAMLLGLVNGVNCILIHGQDESTLRTIYARVLAGDAAHIAEKGRLLATGKHTARDRLGYLKRLISWYCEHRTIPNSMETERLFLGLQGQ